MKGVIFSADFVDDSNEKLKLLELNTDTGFSDYALDNLLNFSEIYKLIIDNLISEIHIIHKPQIHKKFVSILTNGIKYNCPNVNIIEEYEEILDSIYPINVEDSNERLIIRLAYDDLAVFDSDYCKNTINLFKLFIENNNYESIVELYHSSSKYGIIDTLNEIDFKNNIPQLVSKKIETPHFNTQFIKFDADVDIDIRLKEYKQNLDTNDLIQKYHISQTAINQNNAYSIRGYFFVYGDELDLIPISVFSVNTVLPIPVETDISTTPTETSNISILSKKHYYEFATNTLNQSIISSDGVFESETLISASLQGVPITSSTVGMVLKSIFIAGDAPNTDDYIELYKWSYSGSSLPTGSLIVDSDIVNIKYINNHSNLVHQVLFEDGNTFESSYFKPLLVYNNNTDTTKYLQAGDLESHHSVYKMDGTLLKVSHSKYLIPNAEDSIFISINTEESDLYILSGSNIIVHNAPCFVAGTKVLMGDWVEKCIEDVSIGEKIISFNLSNQKNELDFVEGISSRDVLKTVRYLFDDDTELEATPDHPIYVKGKEWASFDNNLSNRMYNIGNVVKIEIGDLVKTAISYKKIKLIIEVNKKVKVYNLSKIKKNQNFYTNNTLVHNRLDDVIKQ